MGAAVAIRADTEAAELRRLARRERDGRVSARLIALANVLDGMGRGAAAHAAGMDRQTLRDWVVRFNAEGVGGLRDQLRPGRPTRMTEGQQAAFKAIVLRGPDPVAVSMNVGPSVLANSGPPAVSDRRAHAAARARRSASLFWCPPHGLAALRCAVVRRNR
jgi:hypothetical protein